MADHTASPSFKSVRLPVLSLRTGNLFHQKYENIDLTPDNAQAQTDLFVYQNGFRIRQGWSNNNGTTKFFWTVNFDYSQIQTCSNTFCGDQATWSWTILPENNIVGRSDVAFSGGDQLSDPTEWPLAKVNFVPETIAILELDASRVGRFRSLISRFLSGHERNQPPDVERKYLEDTEAAIHAEAESELEVLRSQGCTVQAFSHNNRILVAIWPASDRPFRVYRGCTVLLRGTIHFLRRKARHVPCRMVRGEPEDWIATVLGPAPRWSGMVQAPIHAALWNEVNLTPRPAMLGVIETGVEVIPLINPVVRDQMLRAKQTMSNYFSGLEFDNMCQELEGRGPLVEMEHSALPVRALFCPGQPRISTEDYLPGCENADINAIILTSWLLNTSQKAAARQLLQYRFSMILGPPGTGKTQVIAATCFLFTQIMRSRGLAKIAVLVPTHKAGDAVIEKLAGFVSAHPELKNRFHRVRSYTDSCGRLFAGERSINDHDDQARLLSLFQTSAPNRFAHFWRGTREIEESGRILDRNLLRRYHDDRNEMIDTIMQGVDIAVTTIMNVRELSKRHFFPNAVIFDEASFFRDPEIFHALSTIQSIRRAIMVGDPHQLSPPTFTPEGHRMWGISAFERLSTAGYPSETLNIQYRSHHRLYQPTSTAFYDGRVQSDRSHCALSINRFFDGAVSVNFNNRVWILPREIGFFHVVGQVRRDASKSMFNDQEAEIAVRLAAQVIRYIGNILVISPYRAQVALAAKKWEALRPDAETKPRFETVDGVQGAEADFVIVMLTRNVGFPGFMSSPRRINVMTSRARHGVCYIGSWEWVTGRAVADGAPHLQRVLKQYKETVDLFISNGERE